MTSSGPSGGSSNSLSESDDTQTASPGHVLDATWTEVDDDMNYVPAPEETDYDDDDDYDDGNDFHGVCIHFDLVL